MAIPRPKILSTITIPTGGLTFAFTVAANPKRTVTLDAGDYFMAGDGQADDFLFHLTNKVRTEAIAQGDITSGQEYHFYLGLATDDGLAADQHRSNFAGTLSISIDWADNDNTTIGGYLGYDTSSNITTQTSLVSDYNHSHGWYAVEDGQLTSLIPEDIHVGSTAQSVSEASGHVKTHYRGGRYRNEIQLAFLNRDLTYSDGVSYTEANKYGYVRNRPLECWWYEAIQGKKFRVYEQARRETALADDTGTLTSATTTTMTDTGKSWEVDQWVGAVVKRHRHRCYITSNTATVLTHAGSDEDASPATYYIYDQPYQTYVLDTKGMREFAPTEIPAIDRYDISIPVLRYVA